MSSTQMIDQTLLLASGSEYLRYERRCYLVTWQRGPWPKIRPDILGVTTGRKMIEIEVKMTLYDFRANIHKRGQRLRARGRHCPHQFYFLVPPRLVEKVRAELPAGAGLLTLGQEPRLSGTAKIEVVVPADIHRSARRLGLSEMVNLVRHQSGTLCSAAAKLARWSVLRRATAARLQQLEVEMAGRISSESQADEFDSTPQPKSRQMRIENERSNRRRAKAAD